MTSIWMFFLAVAGVTALVLFTAALKRWPTICAISIAVTVLVAWEVPNPPALANIGGTSVYFLDVFSVSALVIVLMRLSSLARNLRSGFWPWIGLGILMLVSLATGLTENPFGKTVNEFRSFFHPYATMTWAMSLAWNREASEIPIRRLALALGWFLTAVAGFHLALYGLGSTSSFVDAGTGLEQTTRPLVSGQALMLLLCGILCFWYWRRNQHKVWLVSALVFLLVVLVSQQRTVWAVGLASAAVIFFSARAGTKGTIVLFTVVAAWGVAILLSAQFVPQMVAEASAAATDSGTYNARVRSWTNLINQSMDKGPSSIIFGQPMGSGFGRFEGVDRWVEFAPHNWYVTLYLRVGIVGLGMLITFLLIVVAALLRRRMNMAALAVVTAVIVYGWSYSWPWYLCIFVGWAVTQYQSELLSPVAPVSIERNSKLDMVRSKEERLQL